MSFQYRDSDSSTWIFNVRPLFLALLTGCQSFLHNVESVEKKSLSNKGNNSLYNVMDWKSQN